MPTCTTFWKKHFWKYLVENKVCFCSCKDNQKVRDFPTISNKGNEDMKELSQGMITIPPNCCHSYALQDNKKENPDDGTGKLLFPFSVIPDRVYGFLL